MKTFKFKAKIGISKIYIDPKQLIKFARKSNPSSASRKFLYSFSKDPKAKGFKTGTLKNNFIEKNKNVFNVNGTIPKKTKSIQKGKTFTKKLSKLSQENRLKFFKLVINENFLKTFIDTSILEFPLFPLLTSFTEKAFDINFVDSEIIDKSGLAQKRELLALHFKETKDLSFEISFSEFIEMLTKSQLKFEIKTRKSKVNIKATKSINETKGAVYLSLNPLVDGFLTPILNLINQTSNELKIFSVLSDNEYEKEVDNCMENLIRDIESNGTISINQKFTFSGINGMR